MIFFLRAATQAEESDAPTVKSGRLITLKYASWKDHRRKKNSSIHMHYITGHRKLI